MKKIAFTLAEVLITLTIIGVIAALTIPNLMQKWQKQETISKLQKANNSITRMANAIKQNSNSDTLDSSPLANITTSSGNTAELTLNFVQLITNTASNLAPLSNNGHIVGILQLKDIRIYRTNWNFPIVLSCEKTSCTDSSFYFQDFFVTSDGISYSLSKTSYNSEQAILVEVILLPLQTILKNTAKRKDLKIGRNVFAFLIKNNFEVIPYPSNDCSLDNWGTGCTKRIIKDGWKMNY